MATLYLGRRIGASGFSHLVAIKDIHPHLADDPAFVQMFVEEALLAARIEHPNVEQAEGTTVDRRADVYALGVMLWELLTGRRLFVADNDLAVLKLVQRPVIVPPSQIVPGVGRELEGALMAALAPAPDARTATAKD